MAAADCAGRLANWEPFHAAARTEALARGASDARFNLQSSSLCLGALPERDLPAWLQEAWAGPLRREAARQLGPGARIDLDQCWLRRQYPPAVAPPGHAPHTWHQDGALHADFAASPPPAPLRMLTCWIALTRCGGDAPSLQWVDQELPALLMPEALSPAAVARRFPESTWRHATLNAGDALLFGGTLLHRTHVLPGMQGVRTSVEIRCFAAGVAAARLRGERVLPLG